MSFIKITFKKINTILSREQTEILETALLSMVPVFLTKVFGFLFGLFAATKFGNFDQDWQNFLLANTIPEFLTNVIIAGTIGSIVIPSFVSSKKNQNEKTFFELFSTILNFSLLLVFVFYAFIFLFGHQLIPFLLNILAPNALENISYTKDIPEIIEKTKLLLVPQLLLGVSTFVSCGLNVYNRFLITHFAPLLYNLGRLFGLIFLTPLFGIYGVVYGIFIGSFLHLVIQLPQAKHVGLKYFFVLKLDNKYIKEIFVVAFPRLLTLAMENIVRVIVNFVSFSIKGGIAALYFADQVISVVPNLFSFTFALASYPKLSLLYDNKDYEKFRKIVIKTLNEILFLVLPVVITLLVLRVPVTRLVFGSLPNTSLSLTETYSIAWNILLFSIGLTFLAGKWFLYRVYYATKDTKTPLFISIFSSIISLVCSFLFINLFSHNTEFAISNTKLSLEKFFSRSDSLVAIGGIPLGLSVGYIVEFLLLFFIFNKYRVCLHIRENIKFFLHKIIASVAMGITMYLVYRTWNAISYIIPERADEFYLGSTTLNLLLLTCITIFISFVVYLLVCIFFKVEEVKIFGKYIRPLCKISGVKLD
ncbi:MAG: oligosaccharide flippase family protein [Candidatus Dojkabacteria bacterium]|nr:oligosaccharide flippase family protein [Candidatus Dojkabacteria bacterium]